MPAEYQREDWADSPDAMVWAKKFVEMVVTKEVNIDEGLMVSWFANAMAASDKTCIRHKIQDSLEVPLMLDILEAWHGRLGCTRQCDSMEPPLYHFIHSKEGAPPTSMNSVMTPPREFSDMKPEPVASKYDTDVPKADPFILAPAVRRGEDPNSTQKEE